MSPLSAVGTPPGSRSSAVLLGLPAEPGTWVSGPPGTETPEIWAVCLLRQEPARIFSSGRGCLIKKDKRRVLSRPRHKWSKGNNGNSNPKARHLRTRWGNQGGWGCFQGRWSFLPPPPCPLRGFDAPPPPQVHLFASTEYYRLGGLGGLTNRNLFPHSPGGEKSQIKVASFS